MKVLWARWRMEYILGEDKSSGCIFCPEAGEDLAERLVFFSGRLTRLMMNKYPYINGHLLVSPRRHTPGLDDLTPAETLDHGQGPGVHGHFEAGHASRRLQRRP